MSKHVHFSLWHCKAESNSVKGKRLSRASRPMTGLCSAFYLVIKRKMDISAWAHAMELLGHSFFVFVNAETEEVNVVYKRKGGTYGLIEADI